MDQSEEQEEEEEEEEEEGDEEDEDEDEDGDEDEEEVSSSTAATIVEVRNEREAEKRKRRHQSTEDSVQLDDDSEIYPIPGRIFFKNTHCAPRTSLRKNEKAWVADKSSKNQWEMKIKVNPETNEPQKIWRLVDYRFPARFRVEDGESGEHVSIYSQSSTGGSSSSSIYSSRSSSSSGSSSQASSQGASTQS